MANIITREHFESVAEKVLNGHRDVRSFDFFKGGVRLMIYSRSGRSSWQANLYYCDEDGNYLDRCTDSYNKKNIDMPYMMPESSWKKLSE